MTQKRFSYFSKIYPPVSFSGGDDLFLEIGINQVVVMVKHKTSRQVEAFEFFQLDGKMQWEKDLAHIKTMSELLNRKFAGTFIYFQIPEALVIPEQHFSQAAAHDFLEQIYGESITTQTFSEKLTPTLHMVVVYRLHNKLAEWLNGQFIGAETHHTYTQLLNTAMAKSLADNPFVQIQFFEKNLSLMVFKNKKLQLIQTFNYAEQEDVLYYLLSIAQQFELDPTISQLEVCGELDKLSLIAQQFPKLFRSVHWDTSKPNGIFGSLMTDFPSHYFTPYFNLAQ
jgi:hypothetical protein